MTSPMDADAVVDFVSAIVAYDNREPTQAALDAWSEAATRGRWTLDEALDALHEHYLASAEFVMPVHISARIRAARHAEHEREVAERLRALPPASADRMSPALQAVHDEANVRACTRCGQPARERCVSPATGRPSKIPCLPRLTGRTDATITRKVPTA